MERRSFLKVLAQGATSALFWRKQAVAFSQPLSGAKPRAPFQITRVSLAGVERGASPGSVRSAVRAAAESATDFSWLTRGDAVFIKPAVRPKPIRIGDLGATAASLMGLELRSTVIGQDLSRDLGS